MVDMSIVYNMFKEYFTHQTYRTEKRVKTSENNARNSNQALTQWIVLARFIQHPSNKAKFIRWVVYTTNAAQMVGYLSIKISFYCILTPAIRIHNINVIWLNQFALQLYNLPHTNAIEWLLWPCFVLVLICRQLCSLSTNTD